MFSELRGTLEVRSHCSLDGISQLRRELRGGSRPEFGEYVVKVLSDGERVRTLMQLSGGVRSISGVIQHAGNRRQTVGELYAVAPNVAVRRPAGEHCRSRGHTHRVIRVSPFKRHSAVRKRIDIRRFDLVVPHTAQVIVA
ncbi:hypothetical protein GCM10028856_18630 [Halopiger thermotolerans]